MLYKLVSDNNLEIIEEYASDGEPLNLVGVSYTDTIALSPLNYGVDTINTNNLADTSSLTGVVSGMGTISGVESSFELQEQAPLEDQATVAVKDKIDTENRKSIEEYTVQEGDTLYGIAQKFGLSINTILWANNLSVNSVLRPGDKLTILPVDGVKYTVKSGDTLSRIASKYNVEQDKIESYNGLESGDVLSIGQELIIPGGTQIAATTSTSKAISRIISKPSTSTSSSSSAAQISSGASAGSMIWPTDLHVITQYFSWKHNGLDIDCYYDNDNYAAAAGYVTIAGWRGGYGYLVEIDHGNGIKTRYGHHAALYVKQGDYVYQGQPIGRCGTTGNSTGTHLHFEVIVNGVRRNPLEYIR